MMTEDDAEYFYTDVTDPGVMDRMLDRNGFMMDRYNKMAAWHRAQKDWHHDNFVKLEARAVMSYEGPATKAKFAAAADDDVCMARTYLSIANAQLGVCEHRLRSLEKEAVGLAVRAKILMQTYTNGRG